MGRTTIIKYTFAFKIYTCLAIFMHHNYKNQEEGISPTLCNLSDYFDFNLEVHVIIKMS